MLGNRADDPPGWLSAGQALERVLLEIARAGYAASPLTQAVEVPSVRSQLRSGLRTQMWPHLLLRVGYAPPTPATSDDALLTTDAQPLATPAATANAAAMLALLMECPFITSAQD